MIATAFYVLGVIVCMILIVLAVVAGLAVFLELLPYLLGFALLALALWVGAQFLATSIGQFLLIGGAIAVAVLAVAKLPSRADKARAEEEKWIAREKNWSERKSPPPWAR
jgi:hypothetical protein